jgi:anti-sigma regulatory factor (Ser/Thr protein kinase)
MRPHHAVPPPPTRAARPPGTFPGDLTSPFEITLAAAVDAPAIARTAVTAWMAGHVGETTLADTQLLVGELVANSVLHADTAEDAVVSVRAEITRDALHLAVEDAGSSGSITRREPDLQHGGGFGLNLVDRLSRRWGVERDAGTRVWAELGIPTDRETAVWPHGNEDTRPDTACALRAPRDAGERAATEYTRGGDHHVADVQVAIARHHEDSAR